MKHDCAKIAVSSAIALGIGYTACALLVHFQPQAALSLAAQVHHLNSVAPLAPYAPYLQVTASNFVSGITQVFAYTFGLVWLACTIHDGLFGKKRK